LLRPLIGQRARRKEGLGRRLGQAGRGITGKAAEAVAEAARAIVAGSGSGLFYTRQLSRPRCGGPFKIQPKTALSRASWPFMGPNGDYRQTLHLFLSLWKSVPGR